MTEETVTVRIPKVSRVAQIAEKMSLERELAEANKTLESITDVVEDQQQPEQDEGEAGEAEPIDLGAEVSGSLKVELPGLENLFHSLERLSQESRGLNEAFYEGVDEIESAVQRCLTALQGVAAEIQRIRKIIESEAEKDDAQRDRERQTLDLIDAYIRRWS
jgi:hypothetical protein